MGILDGWRALSILSVLAGHWLPIGPSRWHLNEAVAASGMAIFFCLSGFLITQLLLKDDRVGPFLVRRLFRILPLAWAAMLILIVANRASLPGAAANLLFYANLPEPQLLAGGNHLWSLCVEVQFYLAIALTVAVFGRRGLMIIPVAALVVTGLRIAAGETISIVTWHRVDEILAGGIVALAWHRWPRARLGWPQASLAHSLAHWLSPLALVLLLASGHPELGPIGYVRPYAAALAVGFSLYAFPTRLASIWNSRPAAYIAETSYAVYVIHGMLTATWLGGEDAGKATRYLLRIPLALVTFALAHLSTRYYEKPCIGVGKRLLQGGKRLAMPS